MPRDIKSWQDKFFAIKPIFATKEADGDMALTGNCYESREAAQKEVDFYKRNRMGKLLIVEVRVHTDELANERWSNAKNRT